MSTSGIIQLYSSVTGVRLHHRLDRFFGLRRSPKVGMQHRSGQVNHRTQRALRFSFQPGAGFLRPVLTPCRERVRVANRISGFVSI
jgi:hypothetical protein